MPEQVCGKKYLFTHRDPKTNMIYGEDISDGKNLGKWVHSEEVTFI